jgi:hypothetical protein
MCETSGVVRAGVELDHRVPLFTARGDPAKLARLLQDENTQLLCVEHHTEKTAKDMGYSQRPTFGADGLPVEDGPHRARGRVAQLWSSGQK